VPPQFSEDLFSALGPGVRPHFRWLVMGPQRSGAGWHVDPNLTSAWNALLAGRKRSAPLAPELCPYGPGPVTSQIDFSVWPHFRCGTSTQPHLRLELAAGGAQEVGGLCPGEVLLVCPRAVLVSG